MNMRQPYTGPLRAVIFDWSGTLIDYGSFGPIPGIMAVFRQRDIEVTPAQVRIPMGMAQRDHLRAVARLPEVSAQWEASTGSPPTDQEIDLLYHEFLPLQLERIPQISTLIPGATEAVAACRRRGLRIGSTTGFSRQVMDLLLPRAAEQGYLPDVVVCPEDAGGGRPAPWMAWRVLTELQVYPAQASVKVGDTPADIAEGINAGMWSVGVAVSGNALGLSREEVAALPAAALEARIREARAQLRQAGAHAVIDTIAELPALLDTLTARLARGEGPIR